ncbi:MAG: hypothetical protein Q4G05_01445 [Clostridia bacterium]|nr:hypothetical protein [Clostridia bacterium]
MKLIKPNEKLKEQFFEYINEVKKDEEINRIGNAYKENEKFNDMLDRVRNREKGKDLLKNDVEATIYWIVDDNETEIMGSMDLRHKLNQSYFVHLGHISYYVRKRKRGKRNCIMGIRRSNKNI